MSDTSEVLKHFDLGPFAGSGADSGSAGDDGDAIGRRNYLLN